MIICTNGCRNPADLRAGWIANGQWMEADFCNTCMKAVWDMYKSTPAMTTATFNQVGQPIHNHKVEKAAINDDMAALRDIL